MNDNSHKHSNFKLSKNRIDVVKRSVRLIVIKSILVLASLLFAAPGNSQHRVLYDLEPNNANEVHLKTGKAKVVRAFKIRNLEDIVPSSSGQDHIKWVRSGEVEEFTQSALVDRNSSNALRIGDHNKGGHNAAYMRVSFVIPDTITVGCVLTIKAWMQNPARHPQRQKPSMFLRTTVDRNLIECGTYKIEEAVVGDGWREHLDYTGGESQNQSKRNLFKRKEITGADSKFLYLQNHRKFLVPLDKCIPGSIVEIEFAIGDCGLGGHWAFGTVDLQIVELGIHSTGELNCSNDNTVTLSAPEGANKYSWDNGMQGRVIQVRTGGSYKCVMETNSGCETDLICNVPEAIRPRNVVVSTSGDLDCITNQVILALEDFDSSSTAIWSNGRKGFRTVVSESGIHKVSVYDIYERPECLVQKSIEVVSNVEIPTPIFSLVNENICVGDSASIVYHSDSSVAVFGDDLHKIWDYDIVGAEAPPIYNTSGVYNITLKYALGKCTTSCVRRLIVNPLPVPSLNFDVVCDPAKAIVVKNISNSYNAIPRLQIWRDEIIVDSTTAESFTKTFIEEEDYRFKQYVISEFGCIGESETVKRFPYDPLPNVAPAIRRGSIKDAIYYVTDNSENVIDRKIICDSINEVKLNYSKDTIEFNVRPYISVKPVIVLTGKTLTCPQQVKLSLSPIAPLNGTAVIVVPVQIPIIPITKFNYSKNETKK